MGELSFALLERVYGQQAARDAETAASYQADKFEQRFDFGDDVFVGGLYGEQPSVSAQTSAHEVQPDSYEQRVYRFAGRVSVVALIDGIPTIEHRNYWPDPEIPSEERLYVHVLDWTQDA